jgi:hypothetical protein
MFKAYNEHKIFIMSVESTVIFARFSVNTYYNFNFLFVHTSQFLLYLIPEDYK